MPELSNGNSSTELDFEKHWSAINVQEEVLRGIKLREQKPRTNETEKYVYVKIPLPSCSKCPDEPSPKKRKTRRVTKKSRLKHVTKERTCPLRVVELAEPSKRHCLNTWKNKGHTLPNYMVDRLRKHVMDETPVVRISEAVNYFKNRKKSSKRRSPDRSKSKYKKMRRDFNMTLSLLFAYKIALMLSKPVNIVLNDELQNIKQVVMYEFNKILRHKNKNGIKSYKTDKILNEMSQKVTIWIANILEETSYKQFLEELEDMEEEEGPVLDILDELLESVLVSCKVNNSSSSVLSAENDSIGTLFSSKKFEDGNESAVDDIYEDKNNFKGSDYIMHPDQVKMTTRSDEKIYYNDEIFPMNEKLTMKDLIQSLVKEKINDIVNNIDIIEDNNNFTNTGDNNDLFGDSNTEYDVTGLNETKDSKNNLPPNKDEDYIVTENNIVPELESRIDFTLEESGSLPTEYIREPNTKESDTKLDSDAVVANGFKLSTEDPDEETKKVKFYNINMVNGENGQQTNKHVFDLTTDYKEPVIWKSSRDYILSHFNVAPPNPELLSYIDEVWPEYTLPPLLKATESVSKSVLSLGRIMEADENILQSPNEKRTMKNTETELNKQLNKAVINLTGEGVKHDDIVNNNKDEEKCDKIINNNINSIRYIQGDNISLLDQLSSHTEMDENRRTKDFPDSKNIVNNEKVPKDEQTKHGHLSSLGKLFIKKLEKPEILTLQGSMSTWIKPTLQERSDVMRIKSNISLKLKRLPINASIKTTKGTSEIPVNNSCNKTMVNKKIQTSFESNLEIDDFCLEKSKNLQKWCMGLLNVAENLELWTAWIQNVNLNIIYLKYEGINLKKDALKNKHIKKWIDLKKNIDVDVQQWSHLGTRLRRGLNTYKSSYLKKKKATCIQPIKNKCQCYHKSSQKSPLCSQCIFNNYHRQFY